MMQDENVSQNTDFINSYNYNYIDNKFQRSSVNNETSIFNRLMKENERWGCQTVKYGKGSPQSESSVCSGIPRIQATCFQCITQCLMHINQTITHFCQNCQYKPLCGLCLQEGSHKMHSVKNVEKTSKIVRRVLTETLISIRAKVNLLQILDQHVMQRQNEMRQQFKEYVENMNNCFDDLQNYLEEKKKQITKIIQQFYKISTEKLIQAQQCAKEQICKLESMIKILSNKAEKLDSSSLCLFYYEKKDILQGIMEEGNSLYENLKKLAPDLRWVINPQIFETIKREVDNLGAKSNSTQIELIYDNLNQSKKKNVKKGNEKPLLKNRVQRRVNFNTVGFMTPKHVDCSKYIFVNNRITQKLSKQMKQSCKLLTQASSQSIDHSNHRIIQGSSIILKKIRSQEQLLQNI